MINKNDIFALGIGTCKIDYENIENDLVELANKYNKTQNQIILNWITNEKKMVALVKSTNTTRIDENKQALDFKMDIEDYQRLNNLRSKEFDNIKVDWNDNVDIPIDQLANQFE